MRLTVYTDYTMRVLMYLSVKYREGGTATIDEIAAAYDISRSHLTKIIYELAQRGLIETVRGRSGGARLARDPSRITVGEVIRIAEKDLAIVPCQDAEREPDCTIFQACNLKRGLRRAMDAFMRELDAMTLAEAVGAPAVAAPLLGLAAPAARGRTIAILPQSRPASKRSRARASTAKTAAVRKPA